MLKQLGKYGWLIVTLAISLPILAYSRFPQTFVDVFCAILVVLALGVFVRLLWPTKADHEKWLQKSWRERRALIWQTPLGFAAYLLFLPVIVIAMVSFATAIDTFFNLLFQYLELLLHPLELWRTVTGPMPK